MEVEDNIEKIEATKRFPLRKSIRMAILTLLYLTVCVQGMTVTIFNAANKNIREALQISEKTHSIFNFIFNVGQFLSIICLMIIMRKPDRKSTVLFSLFASCGLIGLFQFTDNQMILMPSYFFVGFCVMSINVYIILWIDQFAIFSLKTGFLSMINLAKAIGTSLGLLLNNYFTPAKFTNSFLIETILLGIIGCGFLPINSVYFTSDLLLYKGTFRDQHFQWKAKTQKNEQGEEENSLDGVESIYRHRKSGASTQDFDLLYIVFQFTKNRVYVSGFFASAILVSVTGGLGQYAMGFIDETFKFQGFELRNRIMFNICGPLFATIIIFLVSCFVGNYHNKSTPFLMFFFYLSTAICGNIIVYHESTEIKTYCTLLFTIGSSAMVPYLQGVNLSGGTPSRKPFGVIIATAGGIFLGALPAPYIYNTLLKSYPKEKVLQIFMTFLWLGVFFDFLMMVFKYLSYPKMETKPEKPLIELSEKNEK
jgi:hypothetical protein